MPSVATGAVAGQSPAAGHRHQRRRRHGQHRHGPVQARLPAQPAAGLLIENNGCYGLTKGQFSATADLHAHLRRETGEENTVPPFDLCLEAIVAGATFVARSFAGDKKQLVPLLKAALRHQGLAVLDIISPCVTFNDFAGSTKGWEWSRKSTRSRSRRSASSRACPRSRSSRRPARRPASSSTTARGSSSAPCGTRSTR